MAATSGRKRILRLIRPHLVAAAVFSVALNILFLVSPIYMLQVYDRVLTTGSMDTLMLLTAVAVFLLWVYLFAEAGRRRVLARAAQVLSDELAEETLQTGFRDACRSPAETLQAATNLNRVQQALSQALPAPVFDLPFVPAFLLILFFVHPVLGLIGLGGAAALVILALLTERLTREPLAEASKAEQAAEIELRQLVRQRGAIAGMGMGERAVSRWSALRRRGVAETLEAGTPATFLGAATRALRMILQVAILGGGAFFVVRGDVSSGAIIASSIILGRALAPIDQTVNAWRQIVGGMKAFGAISAWTSPEAPSGAAGVTPMPRPAPVLHLDELDVTIPGADKPLLHTIDHKFAPGRIVALLGASGSGKTSLLQTISSAWPPLGGAVRLGLRDLAGWDAADRGQYIGFLPQHVELLRGTVRENIARFADVPEAEVFRAAEMVGCQDLILSLPQGYDTDIGDGGFVLSAGQRQAVGLARAFFRDPPLIVLDEPTAHLDSQLKEALLDLFAFHARLPPEERRFTAIIATHDMRLVNAADDVMMIRDRTAYVTDREIYLAKVSELRQNAAAAQPSVIRQKPLRQSAKAGGPLTFELTRRPDNG